MNLKDAIESMDRYVTHRIPTGGFLRACLENNLVEAFGRADESSARNLHDIVRHIYNELPSSCHGSPEKVSAWLNPPEEKQP